MLIMMFALDSLCGKTGVNAEGNLQNKQQMQPPHSYVALQGYKRQELCDNKSKHTGEDNMYMHLMLSHRL